MNVHVVERWRNDDPADPDAFWHVAGVYSDLDAAKATVPDAKWFGSGDGYLSNLNPDTPIATITTHKVIV